MMRGTPSPCGRTGIRMPEGKGFSREGREGREVLAVVQVVPSALLPCGAAADMFAQRRKDAEEKKGFGASRDGVSFAGISARLRLCAKFLLLSIRASA